MTPNRTRLAWVIVALALLGTAQVPAQDSAAQNLLQEALRLESESSFDEADDSYRLLVERFPDSPQAEEASLALARSLVRRGQSEEALAPLEALISQRPNSPSSAAAAVLLGSIKRSSAQSSSDLEEARTMLSRVPLLYGPEKFTQLEARVEARVQSGEIRLLLGLPQLAALDFLQAIEDEPPSSWLPRARRGLAESFLHQGEWAAAAEILQRLASDGSGDLAAESTRRLTFLHRHALRPSLGQSPWSGTRVVKSSVAWKKPSRVAASPDGRILVVDGGNDLVAELGPDGEILNRSTGRDVRDVWFGADGRGYRATAEAARAMEGTETANLNRAGADKQQITKNLVGGTTGIFGHWLAIDRGQAALIAYDRSSAYAKRVGGEDPSDVALTPTGQILVLDRKAGRVNRLSVDFESVDSFSGNWKRAERIASDAAGNVYVLDTAENRIDLFDAAGQKRGSLGPNLPGGVQLRGAEDLSVDGEGRLYIVDSKLAQLIVLE